MPLGGLKKNDKFGYFLKNKGTKIMFLKATILNSILTLNVEINKIIIPYLYYYYFIIFY